MRAGLAYDEPPKNKSFPHKKTVFRVRFCPKLPPDTENWSAEAFLDIITKNQKFRWNIFFLKILKNKFAIFSEIFRIFKFTQPKFSKEKMIF